MGLTINELNLFSGVVPSGAYYPVWISGATYRTELNFNSETYSESEVDALLTGKSDVTHNHDDRYYTESEVSGFLTGKSDVSHVHDDRYFTESEMDALLSGKADVTSAPSALAYAASLTPDCNDGLYRKITLTGNCTLNPPTNGSDGMKWKARFLASGNSRNLTFSASIKIPSDSSFTGVKTIPSGETYITQLEYGGTAWWLQSLVGGWA